MAIGTERVRHRDIGGGDHSRIAAVQKMTELATINAKIDRLNRKLKADPIVVVSEALKSVCTTASWLIR